VTGGYLLSQESASWLARQRGAAPPPLPGGAGGQPARGLLFAVVEVTGAAAAGWHPAKVLRYLDGVASDDGVCEAKAAAGQLKAGRVYVAVRTGDKADGTARWVAVTPPMVQKTLVTAVSCTGSTLSVTTDTVWVVDA
jgi:hypothetical protein